MRVTLPLASLFPLEAALQPPPSQIASPPRLPAMHWVERHGPLLHPAAGWADKHVLSLNLAQGCLHRCSFCNARAYSSYPGDPVILLPRNLPNLLEEELATLRQLPRAVLLSPSTDPFMPLREVQQLTVAVVQVLARHGVEAWLMTRGYLRPFALEQLVRVRHRIRVRVGFTTLDRQLQRALEPLAAPPRLRLRNLLQLRQLSLPVHVELAPLLPGITDTRRNLTDLLQGLADVGVQQITAGYLFLRSRIEENLRPTLQRLGCMERLLAEYADGPILTSPGLRAARYLPKRRRQHGYATLMALAARHGIRVNICSLSNPDL